MPTIEVTREELEYLIDTVMCARMMGGGTPEYLAALPEIHLKLEDALELWINGGIVELPIPEKYAKLGCVKWEKEYPPHDEGCARHGE